MPLYSPAAASSRLRVYSIHKAILASEELSGRCHSVIGYNPKADVVIVQKANSGDVFQIVKNHKGLIIYDFDDIPHPVDINNWASVCGFFTTDTQRHADMAPTRKDCHVISDTIDYDLIEPLQPVGPNNSLCWFGNRLNEGSVLWMAETLFKAGYDVSFISDVGHPYTGIKLEPWAYETFPIRVREYGACFLSHRSADLGKSANKMQAAVSLGVPCIVDDCGSYAELGRSLALDRFIVSTPDELLNAARILQEPSVRLSYFERAQKEIWDRFNPTRIAQAWVDLMEAKL